MHPSRTRAPSLRRHYPASPVLRAHPPHCRPGLPLTGFRLVCAHYRHGFPCCYRLPLLCVLLPLPRRNRPVLASLASRPVAAFPERPSGRLPHQPFRCMLGFHSRCGPDGRLTANGGPFPSECFRPRRYLRNPLRLLPAGATVAGRDMCPSFAFEHLVPILRRHAGGSSHRPHKRHK